MWPTESDHFQAPQMGSVVIQVPRKVLLNLTELCQVIGRSPKTIREWVKAGFFPPPVKILNSYSWTNLSVGVWLAYVQVTGGEFMKGSELPEDEIDDELE